MSRYILTLVILAVSAALFFIFKSEDVYPRIYSPKNTDFEYFFTYVDGIGIYVLSYREKGSGRLGETLIKDAYPNLSQSCDYIVGRSGASENVESGSNYFFINKMNKSVVSGLTLAELEELILQQKIKIDRNANNVMPILERIKLYKSCDD